MRVLIRRKERRIAKQSWLIEDCVGPSLLLIDQRWTREQSDFKFIRFDYRFHEEFRPGLSLRAPIECAPCRLSCVCACVKSRCAPWCPQEGFGILEGMQEKRDGTQERWMEHGGNRRQNETMERGRFYRRNQGQRSPTITLCHATSTSLWPHVYRCPLLYLFRSWISPLFSPFFIYLPLISSQTISSHWSITILSWSRSRMR